MGVLVKAWILRWGPAILVMIIIFVASAIPGTDLPTLGAWDFSAKKAGHMLGYALLAIAYFHVLNNGRCVTRLQIFSAFVLACLYAASDEWHQKFTPGRSPSVRDVCIDGIGAGIGLALWFWMRSRIKHRNSEFRSRNTKSTEKVSAD